jgi:hypothetical protein
MSDKISAGTKGGGGGAGMVLMRRVSAHLSLLYSIPWVKNGCIFKYILYIPAITVNNNMVF